MEPCKFEELQVSALLCLNMLSTNVSSKLWVDLSDGLRMSWDTSNFMISGVGFCNVLIYLFKDSDGSDAHKSTVIQDCIDFI